MTRHSSTQPALLPLTFLKIFFPFFFVVFLLFVWFFLFVSFWGFLFVFILGFFCLFGGVVCLFVFRWLVVGLVLLKWFLWREWGKHVVNKIILKKVYNKSGLSLIFAYLFHLLPNTLTFLHEFFLGIYRTTCVSDF